MDNDIYSDLTDEEKALLKRDVKRRIEMQRKREQTFTPLVGQLMLAGGIVLMAVSVVISVQVKNAIPSTLFIAGIVNALLGVLVWFKFRKH